jgi:UDP-N-acetyl-D-galactosamine dehydrogenase
MNNKKQITIVVIGLGYVGLPLAIALSNHFNVIGFDNEKKKINEIKNSNHINILDTNNIVYSSDLDDLKDADYYIVTVPTPINQALKPDLSHLIDASKVIAKYLKQGSIVIYESTVYPGATEEVCIPILEENSSLKVTKNFGVGYSPERINPGDEQHTLANVNKLVAADSKETLDKVKKLYRTIIHAEVIEVSSIKVAETSKVIENTQRDLNIGLMNELAMICNKLNIDTSEVINAASSKWNFIPFKPGLVGGHCISVDPYYLTHRAMIEGFSPEIILAGRRVNDNMWKFVVENTLKLMTQSGSKITEANVGILGITFKENCGDYRNSQVLKIHNELLNYKMSISVCDPLVNKADILDQFQINIVEWSEMKNLDVLILAVPHTEFDFLNYSNLRAVLKKNGCIIDVKSFLEISDYKDIPIWKL